MSGRELDVDPVFFFFSGHAETVAPLLRFFSQIEEVLLDPAPSSMILFEYYEEFGFQKVSA